MTVELAGYIWFGVTIALLVAGLIYLGYDRVKRPELNSPEDFFILGFLCAVWPLAIFVAVASLPFWAGHGLGKVSDAREEKRKRRCADEKEALVRLRSSFDRSEPEWSILDEQIKSMA